MGKEGLTDEIKNAVRSALLNEQSLWLERAGKAESTDDFASRHVALIISDAFGETAKKYSTRVLEGFSSQDEAHAKKLANADEKYDQAIAYERAVDEKYDQPGGAFSETSADEMDERLRETPSEPDVPGDDEQDDNAILDEVEEAYVDIPKPRGGGSKVNIVVVNPRPLTMNDPAAYLGPHFMNDGRGYRMFS